MRMLPEYFFYIILPIVYILPEFLLFEQNLVGMFVRISEIQTTTWAL